MHGGRAPQVAAAREARIIQGEAALAAADEPRRTPGEALLAAAGDADQILQQLKRRVQEGQAIDGPLLQALGDWLDRTARLSKVVLDARIDERKIELQQGQAKIVIAALRSALEVVDLEPWQRRGLMAAFLQGLGFPPADGGGTVVSGELGE